MNPGHTIPVLDHGFVRYVDHYGSDQRIVEAARISYKSPSKGDEADKKLIGYLYRHKHGSPFELAGVTLNIKMPIFVMRQYVRHRIQSINELSARYTELPSEFYIPTRWRQQDATNKQGSVTGGDSDKYLTPDGRDAFHSDASTLVSEHCRRSYELYQAMLEDGISREMARMVLPVNIYTEIYALWNLRSLFNFISLREDSHAQAEIQDYGRAIKTILKEIFPWTMEAYDKYKFVLELQED